MVSRLKRALARAIDYSILTMTLLLFSLIVTPYARLERNIRLHRKEKPRILWGATPIINIRYGSLAARLYGYESNTLVYDVYPINQPSDFDYVLARRFQFTNLPFPALLYLVMLYATFLWASLRYDIFHYYFDGGLLRNFNGHWLELPLLHLAGKKIIAIPYGGDARLESQTKKYKYNFCMDCTPDSKTCDEKKIQRNVDYFCQHADLVLGCADIVESLPRHDGMWFYPIDLAEWQPRQSMRASNILKVVHASNHRKYKGTRHLIAAVDELKSEGYPIELILIERMPNSEAKKIYQQADIIADQFIGGAYALFAIEGMALGKPVMCYLRQDLFTFHPEWAECPIVNTNPDNLKQQLTRLITDSRLREELGQRGRDYVRKYHSLESVGKQLDTLYRRLWYNERKD